MLTVAYLEIGKGVGHKNWSEERKSSSWVHANEAIFISSR